VERPLFFHEGAGDSHESAPLSRSPTHNGFLVGSRRDQPGRYGHQETLLASN
jgi:hypothetical protein